MEPVETHTFCFNPKDNGGEALILATKFVPNGDPGVILLEQELSLMSYCNAASFTLTGAQMTPDKLRQLANELDEALIEAKAKAKLENL